MLFVDVNILYSLLSKPALFTYIFKTFTSLVFFVMTNVIRLIVLGHQSLWKDSTFCDYDKCLPSRLLLSQPNLLCNIRRFKQLRTYRVFADSSKSADSKRILQRRGTFDRIVCIFEKDMFRKQRGDLGWKGLGTCFGPFLSWQVLHI